MDYTFYIYIYPYVIFFSYLEPAVSGFLPDLLLPPLPMASWHRAKSVLYFSLSLRILISSWPFCDLTRATGSTGPKDIKDSVYFKTASSQTHWVRAFELDCRFNDICNRGQSAENVLQLRLLDPLKPQLIADVQLLWPPTSSNKKHEEHWHLVS